MTFADFQASRQEIADYGAHCGLPSKKGVRAFVYANLAPIEEHEDWIDGGFQYEAEGRSYKSLSDAEAALFKIWEPILDRLEANRAARGGADWIDPE